MNNRKPLYAKIAIARKQLPDMTEEAYRELLANEFNGTTSAAKLSWRDLNRLVDLLASLGAVYVTKGQPSAMRKPGDAKRSHWNASVTSKSRPDWIEVREDDPLANEKRAILAIWKGLGYSMSSLDTRVKRNFGVESFAWLHDTRSVCMLLSDLQRRERARKRKQDVNG